MTDRKSVIERNINDIEAKSNDFLKTKKLKLIWKNVQKGGMMDKQELFQFFQPRVTGENTNLGVWQR